ncbi:hypothetical protein Nmel_017581, partial [Mimus melanotis]
CCLGSWPKSSTSGHSAGWAGGGAGQQHKVGEAAFPFCPRHSTHTCHPSGQGV